MPADTTGTAGAAPAAPQPRDASTGQFRSMSEAVSALSSLLDPSEGQSEGDEATGEEHEEAGAEEAQVDESESQEEGAEDQADEADDEATGSDDEEEGEQPSHGRKFTVRIDGKDEKVDESELIAGYSRQSDYTRKTQALANDRKAFEQEHAQTRQERTEYAQLLPMLRNALATGMGQEPNWAELQAKDPNRFTFEWARWQQGQARIAAVQAEERKVAQRQAAEAEAMSARRQAEEREALHRALPQWKDPKVAKRESQMIAQMMRDVGYADDDIAIHDSKALVIARKAALYDALQAKRPELRQRMRSAPVVRSGGGEPAPRTARTAAAKRFGQTGSVKDAASLLETMI